MKKLMLLAVALLIAGLMIIPGFPQAGPPMERGFFMYLGAGRGWGKTVTGAPFSAQAVTEYKQTLANGNIIDRKETASIYRDSAGRTRFDRTLSMIGPWSPSGTPPQITIIHDPVAGFSYILNTAKKVAYKTPLPPPRTSPLRKRRNSAHSSWQVSSQSLGTKMIDAVEAQGTQTTLVIPAGSIGNAQPITVVSERWYSPDLQIDVMTKRDDPRFGETTYQLTNIQLGEPQPSLFQIPPDFAIQLRSARHPPNAAPRSSQ